MSAKTDGPAVAPALCLTAAALGRAYATGQADPEVVTEAVLRAIAEHPDQAIFITVTADRARQEAQASARRYTAGHALGPLDGVPVAWKDLMDVAGTVTTAGSATRRHAPAASQDAPVVQALAAAGMICVGKVNLSEFAFSALGVNDHFGTPRNPADPLLHRVPGGSSSGSAAAVAAGLVPVAIGSDTGGSIRIPAAFNGVVGFKVGEGRIGRDGVFPLSETLDTVGPIARTVEDCALVEAALRGREVAAPARAAPGAIRLVVPENVVFDGIEPAVLALFERAIERLRSAGVVVDRQVLPILSEVAALTVTHGSLTNAEAYRLHRDLVESPDAARIDQRVLRRILDGKKMSAYDLLQIQSARRRLRHDVVTALGGRVLAFPTVRHVAPTVAAVVADIDHFIGVNLRTGANTILGNILDLCGLALPIGRDPQGMPGSLLLSLPAGDEDKLLAAGLTVESLVAVQGG